MAIVPNTLLLYLQQYSQFPEREDRESRCRLHLDGVIRCQWCVGYDIRNNTRCMGQRPAKPS